jgi:hypothetical protein
MWEMVEALYFGHADGIMGSLVDIIPAVAATVCQYCTSTTRDVKKSRRWLNEQGVLQVVNSIA